jgi:hypothetical protein
METISYASSRAVTAAQTVAVMRAQSSVLCAALSIAQDISTLVGRRNAIVDGANETPGSTLLAAMSSAVVRTLSAALADV